MSLLPPECSLPGANNWAPRCGGGFFGAGQFQPSPPLGFSRDLGPPLEGSPIDPGQLAIDVGNPFAPPPPVVIAFVPPPTIGTPGAPGLAPSFPPPPVTGPPSLGPLPFSEVTTPPPPPFYEVPPPPPPPTPLVDLLAPAEPFIGTLGLLGGIGLAGIATSIAVGAPAPDEYGTQDIQALIDAGFYGNLTPNKLVPQYQPPDLPSQTELAPAVAPAPSPDVTLPDVVVTAPRPVAVPEIPIYVVPPFFPGVLPNVTPFAPGYPLGLPAPGGAVIARPGPATRPAPQPAGATAPLAGSAPLPAGVSLQSPATGTAPATGPGAATAPAQLTGPTTITGPAPSTSPLTDPQPDLQPAQPKPALAQLTSPAEQLGSVPVPQGTKGDCAPGGKQKQKQKKQQRKDRTVCHSGTYIERRRGLSKHAMRQVPCR